MTVGIVVQQIVLLKRGYAFFRAVSYQFQFVHLCQPRNSVKCWVVSYCFVLLAHRWHTCLLFLTVKRDRRSFGTHSVVHSVFSRIIQKFALICGEECFHETTGRGRYNCRAAQPAHSNRLRLSKTRRSSIGAPCSEDSQI